MSSLIGENPQESYSSICCLTVVPQVSCLQHLLKLPFAGIAELLQKALQLALASAVYIICRFMCFFSYVYYIIMRYTCIIYMGVSTNESVWFTMENHIKLDDLGRGTPISGDLHIIIFLHGAS